MEKNTTKRLPTVRWEGTWRDAHKVVEGHELRVYWGKARGKWWFTIDGVKRSLVAGKEDKFQHQESRESAMAACMRTLKKDLS